MPVAVHLPSFCTQADDPCTCKGGGFEIYEPFCNVSKGNLSSSSIFNISLEAQSEYASVPESLDTGVIAVAAGTVVIVGVIFVVYRAYQSLWAVQAKVEQMDRNREAERQRQQEESTFLAERLAEATARLAAEIKGNELSFDAIEFEEGKEGIVSVGQSEITLIEREMKLTSLCSHAPVAALLPVRVGQLGQGAFGVVRRARYQGETVAVKKIKVAASRLFWREEDAAAVDDFISEINVMNGLR